MSPLRLLTVVSASLLLMANADGEPDGQPQTTIEYSVKLGNDGECLSEINGARNDAGFNNFVIPQANANDKRLPAAADKSSTDYPSWVWKPVCDVLIPEETPVDSTTPTEKFAVGTYAYQVVDIPDAVNCTAVVDTWQTAYTNFDGVPPSEKQNEDIYKKQSNVSLVAMYNPSENATADCRVVTCTKKTTTSQQTPSLTADQSNAGQQIETKGGSALICLTMPDVLSTDNGTPPFTEQQWEKIVTAIKGSASSVFPSVFGLAAAVIGLVAVM